MSQTTNIYDLPTDPRGSNSSINSMNENVSLVANEITNTNKSSDFSQPINLDQTTINQIINGLQQASSSGITMLPSRDIPQNTLPITQDPQIQPNYIPPPEPTRMNYIDEYESESNKNIIQNYNQKMKHSNTLDSLYDEIQVPLLLVILYFIFQLPIFKSTLFKYIPLLCNKDGNMNINGIVFTSVLYGGLYYFLSKLMFQINQI